MSKSSKSKNIMDREKQNQEDGEMNPSIFNSNQSILSDNKKYLFTSQSINNINNNPIPNVNYQSSLLFSTNNNQNFNNNTIIPRTLNMSLSVNSYINNQNPPNLNYGNLNKNKDEKILIKANFEKLLTEKLNKYSLTLKQNNFNDILNTLNNGLDLYLKNMLEKLIIISRARNVNLNLYSKLSEKNPVNLILINNSYQKAFILV